MKGIPYIGGTGQGKKDEKEIFKTSTWTGNLPVYGMPAGNGIGGSVAGDKCTDSSGCGTECSG